VLGKEPEIRGFTGGLDTRFGPYFGTPVSYSPKGDRFHGPDEYVEVDSIHTVSRVLAKFVIDWCGWEKYKHQIHSKFPILMIRKKRKIL